MGIALRATVGVVLLSLGWAAGRAQTSEPEFTLELDAPVGWSTVVCVKGCALQGGRDLGVPGNLPKERYDLECGGPGAQRCKATINGWRRP